MKKLKISKEQDVFYGDQFGYYMNNVRSDTKRADRYAWRQVINQWPKLKGARR